MNLPRSRRLFRAADTPLPADPGGAERKNAEQKLQALRARLISRIENPMGFRGVSLTPGAALA